MSGRVQLMSRVFAVFSLLAAWSAWAEPKLRPLWEAGAGVGVLSLPDYRGADEQRTRVFPIPYVVYRGEVLQVDRERIRRVLYRGERWDIDLSISGTLPGRRQGSPAREGMPELDPTLEFGPQLNVRLLDNARYRLSFHLPARNARALGDGLRDVGWLVSPTVRLEFKDAGTAQGWKFAVSGGPVWADRRLHDYFYAVEAAHARPDRPAYAGRGGYSGTDLTATLTRRFGAFWAGGFLRVSDLHGTAFEDSPLLRRKTSFIAGFGISWVFGQSGQLVMSDE